MAQKKTKKKTTTRKAKPVPKRRKPVAKKRKQNAKPPVPKKRPAKKRPAVKKRTAVKKHAPKKKLSKRPVKRSKKNVSKKNYTRKPSLIGAFMPLDEMRDLSQGALNDIKSLSNPILIKRRRVAVLPKGSRTRPNPAHPYMLTVRRRPKK